MSSPEYSFGVRAVDDLRLALPGFHEHLVGEDEGVGTWRQLERDRGELGGLGRHRLLGRLPVVDPPVIDLSALGTEVLEGRQAEIGERVALLVVNDHLALCEVDPGAAQDRFELGNRQPVFLVRVAQRAADVAHVDGARNVAGLVGGHVADVPHDRAVLHRVLHVGGIDDVARLCPRGQDENRGSCRDPASDSIRHERLLLGRHRRGPPAADHVTQRDRPRGPPAPSMFAEHQYRRVVPPFCDLGPRGGTAAGLQCRRRRLQRAARPSGVAEFRPSLPFDHGKTVPQALPPDLRRHGRRRGRRCHVVPDPPRRRRRSARGERRGHGPDVLRDVLLALRRNRLRARRQALEVRRQSQGPAFQGTAVSARHRGGGLAQRPRPPAHAADPHRRARQGTVEGGELRGGHRRHRRAHGQAQGRARPGIARAVQPWLRPALLPARAQVLGRDQRRRAVVRAMPRAAGHRVHAHAGQRGRLARAHRHREHRLPRADRQPPGREHAQHPGAGVRAGHRTQHSDHRRRSTASRSRPPRRSTGCRSSPAPTSRCCSRG